MSKVRRVLLQIKSKISYTLQLIVTYTFFVTETPGNEEASQFKRKTFSFIATSSKSKHGILHAIFLLFYVLRVWLYYSGFSDIKHFCLYMKNQVIKQNPA